VGYYHPGSLALLRYLIASICMIFIWQKNPGPSKVAKKDLPLLIATGVVGIAFYNLSLNYAEINIPASEANFFISQSPVISALLAIFFLGEIVQKRFWIGLIISVLGVSLIALANYKLFVLNNSLILILAATLFSGLYTIMQKPLVSRIQPVRCTCYIIWICAASLSIYFPQLFTDIQNAPLSATLAVIYLGIFPAAIAYALWGFILSKLSATKTASTLYLVPFITILLSKLILGETPKLLSFIGGIIALIGAYIINQRSRVTKIKSD